MRIKIYIIFYVITTVLSLVLGMKLGFTDTHTPPVPFAVSLLTVIVGLVLLAIDRIFFKKNKDVINTHIIGLIFNGIIILGCIMGAL